MREHSNDSIAWMAGLIVGMVISTIVYTVFTYNADVSGKDSAIKAGVAEYVCDPVTGKTTFRFKTK